MVDNPPMLRQSNRVEGKTSGREPISVFWKARKREQGFLGRAASQKKLSKLAAT